MAESILMGLLAYAILGLVFALAFVSLGVERVDPAAHGAAWAFRLLIVPGVATLWPLLALRWWKAAAEGRP